MGSQISAANAINSIVEQSDRANASTHIVSAIQSAATKTGVNFSFLMQKASQESSFDPQAKATTSSATGLFQFTSQTWLHMIKEYGDQYGLSDYASQIDEAADGRLSVDDPSMRQAILALRKDPQVSAEMAGELDKENAAILQRKVGGKIGSTELYLAHFLGAGGASQFIRQMRSNPQAVAADLMPTAAAANPSVFYSKSGEARSLQQIYQKFAQKFDHTGTQVASLTLKPTATDASLSLATAGALSTKIANLLPTETAGSVRDAATSVTQADSKNMKIASLGSSSLFNAMVLSQVQDTEINKTAVFSSFDQEADNKKKAALSTLASLA